MTGTVLRIPRALVEAIVRQGAAEAPIEACGYLAGRNSEIQTIIPMSNADRSPEHFSFDPEEQFAAMDKAAREKLQLIAVYHTHPETPARMSEEDIRLAYDTEIAYLIYSLSDRRLKGFRVEVEWQARTVREISLQIL